MNLYLTGMMGSGKSVTGKKLATLMDCAFVDLDEQIEKREGKTIPKTAQLRNLPNRII